jgi:methylated-DNA-[protein]-cysteine S-methyltransferase
MFDMSMMRKIERTAVLADVDSPVGTLTLIASDAGLHALLWPDERALCTAGLALLRPHPDHPVLIEASRQLAEYFAGARRAFELELAPRGTPFQRQIWDHLQKIPYGETRTYGELAAATGNIQRARAVGMANGKNPIGIMIPCHRVIGRSGALTGFGGGLDTKAFLIGLEQRFRSQATPATRPTSQP